jgi:hypothetical protein
MLFIPWYSKMKVGMANHWISLREGFMKTATNTGMNTSTYEFENKEDREEAFHNIVKWFGANIVEKLDHLLLKVRGSEALTIATNQIVAKHEGRNSK